MRQHLLSRQGPFEPTGVEAIDLILSAVASAGKGYHHTDGWSEPFNWQGSRAPFRGDSYIEWIQNAANDAAALVRTPQGGKGDALLDQQEGR